MRRALLTLVAASACLAALACQPSTPKATISATPESAKPGCRQETDLHGAVKPAGATRNVTLQRTVGGKWVDWKWKRGSSGGEIKYLSTKVLSDGTYRLRFTTPDTEGQTYHLRVRSEGGGVFSNDVYITPTEYPWTVGGCGS